MNTEDFKCECAECYLCDECDAMYGGKNPPCTEVALQSASDNSARDAITPLVVRAVTTDGGHHKQWYLEAIAEAFQIELPPHDLGIAP